MATTAQLAGKGQIVSVANGVQSVRFPLTLRCAAGSRALAIIQIVSGSILILLDFIGYGFGTQRADFMTQVGGNIWSGVFFFITGVVGLRAARKPIENVQRKCLLTASLVLNIIGSVIAAAVFSAGIPATILATFFDSCQYESQYESHRENYYCRQVSFGALLGLRISAVILDLLLLIVSIVNAAFGCCNVCRSDTQLVQVVYVPVSTGILPPGPAMMDSSSTSTVTYKLRQPVAGESDGRGSASNLLGAVFDPPPKYEQMKA